MTGLVLAAGLGKRLAPLTDERPKGLLELGGRTLLARLLDGLQAAGVRLHEIADAKVIYPADGPLAAYFYRHPDPVAAAYWLDDDVIPSIEQAIARCHGRSTAPALA